jgi:membrane protease YdiL (CAAX protease family)
VGGDHVVGIAIVLIDQLLCNPIRWIIDIVIPDTKLGSYPKTTGWLHLVDLVFGLALVATSEEILFRRCMRHMFQPLLGEDKMVIVTSLIFGAYHWWTGIGNVVAVALLGVPLMLFYLRSKALWPVVVAHYFTDVLAFG